MANQNPRSRDLNLDTDAGKLRQHPVDAQPTPTQIRVPPERLAPKIKKSTPDEFDKNLIYVEPEDAYPDELEYSRNKKDQGIVIIFNQVTFKDEFDKRRGSTKDVNDIIFTLGRLGYNIDDKYIFSSLTSVEIWKKIKEICEEDLSDKNSLILFFLTHGEKQDMLLTKDSTINTKDIWDTLGRHKDLENKPKFFVFQACKGHSISTPYEKEQSKNKDKGHVISYLSLSSYQNIPPDILLCYSSVEGMQSYRNRVKGSWFIQEICKNFMMYGRRDDVISLLTRVIKCVSTYTNKQTKQMPVLVSTLSKKFYLCKTKDRTNKLAACKGESLSTPYEKGNAENEIVEHTISYVSLSSYQNIPPDILLCYSSVEGMKSYRDIEKGSWFIQEICKNFLMYGRRDDVISLLTRVKKCVSTYTFRDTKQMPVLVSTLSKKFYLCKTKDRTNKLAIYQLYRNILNGLRDISSEIEILEKSHDSRK